jgi:hypothetical protein
MACPDEAAVRASVAGLLAGSSAAVDARAEVRRIGERWQVLLTMNGGERRLEADSCHALAEATALIVAMAVDPARVAANRIAREAGVASGTLPRAAPTLADAATDASPAESSDASTPTPTPTPLPSATATPPPTATPTPTATPPSTPRPPDFALSAAGAVDTGTLPTVAFGPSVGVGWLPGPFRLELSAAYFPSSTASASSPFPATAQFSLLTFALRGCYAARLASFELGPCVGGEGGALWATLQGAQGGGSAPLFALEAGLRAGWRFLPAWSLFARGDALLQALRPEFQPNASSNPLFSGQIPPLLNQPALVTARGSLGVELRF